MEQMGNLRSPEGILWLAIITIGIGIIVLLTVVLSRLNTEKRVTKAALELKRLTNSIQAGLVHFVLEDQCYILYASKGFYELVGYEKEDLKKTDMVSLLQFIDKRDIHIFKEPWTEFMKEAINCEVRVVTKHKNVLYVLMSGNVEIGKDGKHTVSAVMVDISEQKKMQELISIESERYRIATELSKDILFEYDAKSDTFIFTDKIKNLFGIDPVIPNFIVELDSKEVVIHPDDWGIYLELREQLVMGKNIIEAEIRLKNHFGAYIWCQVMGKTIYTDGKEPLRTIGKLVNVDMQKRELEALEFKATRDPLTGVYNKEVSIKKIEKFIQGNKNNKHVLMFIDFDDFKNVNSNFGHLRGDKVLIYVVDRIKNVFHDGEIIGRSGGDEFVVFCGNITDVNSVLKKASILKEALNTIYQYESYEIPISGSIGIAMYPKDGITYEQLLECADEALYQVKADGKNNYKFFSEHVNEYNLILSE